MFSSSISSLVRFLADDEGAGLIEYALILSIVSITSILAMIFMKDQLASLLGNIGITVGQYPSP